MGSINLEYLKQGFSSLLHQAENAVMPAFVYWLDLKLAEYKVNGFILTEIEPQCNDDWTQYIQAAVDIQRAPCENSPIEQDTPANASQEVNLEVHYPNQNVGDPVLQVSQSLFAKKKNRSGCAVRDRSNLEEREDNESLVSIKSDPDEVIMTDTPPVEAIEERINKNNDELTEVPSQVPPIDKEVLLESLSLVSKEQMSVISKQEKNKSKIRMTRQQQAEKERAKEKPTEAPKKSKFVTELLKTLHRSDSSESGEVNIGGKKYLIAKQNADLLQSKNIRVIVTQSKDKFKELLERHNLPHVLANQSNVVTEGHGVQGTAYSNVLASIDSEKTLFENAEEKEVTITRVVKPNDKRLSREGKSNGNVEQSPVKRKVKGSLSPATKKKKGAPKLGEKLIAGKTFLSRNMRSSKKSGPKQKVSTRICIDLPSGNQKKFQAETTMKSPLKELECDSPSTTTPLKSVKQDAHSRRALRNSPSLSVVKLTNIKKDLTVQRHQRQMVQNRHKLRRKSLGTVLLRLNPERMRPARQRSSTQPSIAGNQNRRKNEKPNKVVGKTVNEKTQSPKPEKTELSKLPKTLQPPPIKGHSLQKGINENHQCGQCGLNFNSFPSYTKHLRTHKNEFNHICESCCIGFLNSESLKNHKCIRTNFRFLDKPDDK